MFRLTSSSLKTNPMTFFVLQLPMYENQALVNLNALQILFTDDFSNYCFEITENWNFSLLV